MNEAFNTIDLEIKDTNKVSILYKIMALILVLIFVVTPMYEFLSQFAPIDSSFVGCIVYT